MNELSTLQIYQIISVFFFLTKSHRYEIRRFRLDNTKINFKRSQQLI